MNHLFLEALSLKHINRAGWLRVGIDAPESVAAHSWGVAWLVLNHAPKEIDTLRALQLSLVHDVPEVVAGDITPHDNVPKAEKRRLERMAAESLFQKREWMLAIWEEYEAAQTKEALFVKECDKLDMALQAIRYSNDHSIDTTEFIDSAKAHIRTPALIGVLNQALSHLKPKPNRH